MKNKLLFGSVLSVFCGLALPSLVTTTSAADSTVEVALTAACRLISPVPTAARASRCPWRSGAESAQVLIGRDGKAAYALAAGKTSLILSLSED